jgi:hypothetical protein
MAEILEVIWPMAKAEYFWRQDWTAQITLNRLAKFVPARTPTMRDKHRF